MTTTFSPSYLLDRNSLLIGNEPHVIHCHHYNTFLQHTIETANNYLDVYPILINSSHELAYNQFKYFFSNGETTIEERKFLAQNFAKHCGFGNYDFSTLSKEGGKICVESEHYSKGWLIKFGKRKDNEQGVSFFARGFISGAFEAIFDLPLGASATKQLKCLTKGDSICEFEVQKLQTPTLLESSPEIGKFETFEFQNPTSETGVDYIGIRNALINMPMEGDENGVIDAFGVLVTKMYSNYYCLISYRFLKQMSAKYGADGIQIVEMLLTESGHVCAFNTFGGIMQSAEWYGLIFPMLKNREDWVHGIVAVINALGWGKWEVKELIPNQKLVIRVYSGYESNSYLEKYNTSQSPVSFLAKGGTAGIMNLVYEVDITEKKSLTQEFYNSILTNPNKFISTQSKCRAKGDDYDEFISLRINNN